MDSWIAWTNVKVLKLKGKSFVVDAAGMTVSQRMDRQGQVVYDLFVTSSPITNCESRNRDKGDEHHSSGPVYGDPQIVVKVYLGLYEDWIS